MTDDRDHLILIRIHNYYQLCHSDVSMTRLNRVSEENLAVSHILEAPRSTGIPKRLNKQPPLLLFEYLKI